jgi:AIPR protein
MNINKHIIDQRIQKIVLEKPEWFADQNDEVRKVSRSFVLLAVSSYLSIELSEAYSILTDGGGDAGIDAIYVGDTTDVELPVTIFQGKYKKNLETDANFPANEVQKVIGTIRTIFDTEKDINTINPILKAEIEEIRSLISDGYIPVVKVVLFNNGIKWNDEGQQHLANANFPKEQVEFEYINHENIVDFIQTTKEIKASLKLTGESFVENFNFKRVLIGKVNVKEIANLFRSHGDGLLEKNIRRYLGLNRNRVNEAIQETLLGERKDNFYFKNNGITMVCRKFSYNALQEKNWEIIVEDLQIINGGQTCKTIEQTIENNEDKDFSQVYVLIRLYELSDQQANDDLINEITLATNSQNPVDLSDLRSNDILQRTLETDIKLLGYNYRRKKDIASTNEAIIPLSVAAQAIYSIWKEKPHVAKFKRKELFGSLYNDVFKPEPNAAQLVIAVLIYRFCDNQRRKIALIEEFPHMPYSNYFLSMIIGKLLLRQSSMTLNKLNHKNFEEIKTYFETNKEILFFQANEILIKALSALYNDDYKNLDLLRLSAAFRRGDLFGNINIA